jgi:hypothetical protein
MGSSAGRQPAAGAASYGARFDAVTKNDGRTLKAKSGVNF